ncbi:MAG: hypothetical protein R3284_06365 [Rubricoccaceae bacterium]|nr:hypothetical protein [Rubricoccaceae bacterium]
MESVLSDIDLSVTLDQETYRKQRDMYQEALQALGHPVFVEKRPVVMVFEGWDAAGKGGAIRHAMAPIDPRGYVVHPIGPPEGEDARRHYLYRFWRRLPEAGRVAVFDRSWYGRVLVERVEGFASEQEWRHAYREIREFELQLTDFGTVLFKFWLHLSPEEQLRRFRSREADPRKQWKLTDEDWRNREKWAQYLRAADEMIFETNTPHAPWTIVEADCKRWARVKILRTIVEHLNEVFC